MKHARAQRASLELGAARSARAAEGAWISTIHGFCARVLRAHALSAGIDPDFRVLDELEAERIAADAFDAALEAFMGRPTPSGSRWSPPTPPDGLQRHGAHRLLAPAQPRGAPARGSTELPTPPPARPAERAERRGARPPWRELGAAGAACTVAPRDRASSSAAPRCSSGCPPASWPSPASCKDSRFGGNAKALCTDACVEYSERAGARTPRSAASSREYRDHGMLRELLELYGERYEPGQARPLGARLRGPGAARPRPARRPRGAARPVRRALRARARGRVPGHQPAAERAARAARARQPVPRRRREPVDLRLPPRRRRGLPRALGERRRGRPRPRASPSTSAAAARCWRRSTAASSGVWPDRFEPLREGAEARAQAPPGASRASSCW